MEVANLWEKISLWAKFLKNWLKKKAGAYTMDERRHSKHFSPNWKSWCVMDSKHNKCAPIIEWRQLMQLWCGAQGANQKI
jgi:hypothetical protein